MSRSSATPDFGPPIRSGEWELRTARDPGELGQLLALRARCLRGDPAIDDSDRHDADCLHLWIGRPGNPPLATLRLQHHATTASLLAGYSAEFFDLRPLAAAPGTTLELGRLCLHPQEAQASMMRLVWTAIARLVERTGAERMIGCTSLIGADPAAHRAVLGQLATRHLGPAELRPRAGTAEAFSIAGLPAAGRARLPPILRGYMALGGWVSDMVVIDRHLDTCLVFTCVEVARMPESRRRLLHSLGACDAAPPPADERPA
jgi:L-ornithine Nalpha-acyltransferase